MVQFHLPTSCMSAVCLWRCWYTGVVTPGLHPELLKTRTSSLAGDECLLRWIDMTHHSSLLGAGLSTEDHHICKCSLTASTAAGAEHCTLLLPIHTNRPHSPCTQTGLSWSSESWRSLGWMQSTIAQCNLNANFSSSDLACTHGQQISEVIQRWLPVLLNQTIYRLASMFDSLTNHYANNFGKIVRNSFNAPGSYFSCWFMCLSLDGIPCVQARPWTTIVQQFAMLSPMCWYLWQNYRQGRWCFRCVFYFWCLYVYPTTKYYVCRQGLEQQSYCNSRRTYQGLCWECTEYSSKQCREQSHRFCLWRIIHASGDKPLQADSYKLFSVQSCKGMHLGDDGAYSIREAAPSAHEDASAVAAAAAGAFAPAAAAAPTTAVALSLLPASGPSHFRCSCCCCAPRVGGGTG